MNGRTREASHAGSWYEARPEALHAQLQRWLDEVQSQSQSQSLESGRVRAVIAPHAGYSYSGPTAAWAYAHLDPKLIQRVFVLGPSHHVYLENCAVPSVDLYETPFGSIPIDREIVRQLESSRRFSVMTKDVDEDEHSIEMHIPFIHHMMQSQPFQLVPILVGSLTPAKEAEFASILAPYLADQSNFFVISSDFCHWGKRFRYTNKDTSKGPIHKSIEALDMQAVNLIEKQDCAGFTAYLKETKNTICGRHPIGLFLNMSRLSPQPLHFKFVKYAQSSQAMTESDSSVSYCSIIVSEQTK